MSDLFLAHLLLSVRPLAVVLRKAPADLIAFLWHKFGPLRCR